MNVSVWRSQNERKKYDYVTLRLSASYCVAAEHMSKEHESLEQGLLDQGQSTAGYGTMRLDCGVK